MSVVTGIFAVPKTNKFVLIAHPERQVYTQVNSFFKKWCDKGLKVYLSLDQSTTCTGICMALENFQAICLLDYKRQDSYVDDYKEELKSFVDNLVTDLKLKLIVMERPLVTKNRHSTKVLQGLAKYVRSWRSEINEFRDVPFDSIFPQQWKERVVDKKKGKYRTGVKLEIAEDICDIYPILRNYLYQCPAKDLDSFDSLGILIGYLRQHYTSDGEELNYGTIEYFHKIHVFPVYVPEDEVDKVIDRIPIQLKDPSPRKFHYNNKYSFRDNAAIICSKVPIGYFAIDDLNLKINMLWETGETVKPGYTFVCIVCRSGQLKDNKLLAVKQTLGNYFYI